MTAPIFVDTRAHSVDTNVLIYAFEAADLRKQQAAALWQGEPGYHL
jgi:predicted nucleic acid-binding protein